jgi:hypothetical protein
MDVLDKFLKQYLYKFDKGYPDINNPKDKEMLFEFADQLINEQQLNLFSDEILDNLKVDLRIDNEDFDTEKELRNILNKADNRVKEKYKLNDPEMFEKIINAVMNARLQPELLNLLRKKGYSKIILDRYATELASVFNSVADKDRDKFINYITSNKQKSFTKQPVGNIKSEIKSTGMSFEDDAVLDNLINEKLNPFP